MTDYFKKKLIHEFAKDTVRHGYICKTDYFYQDLTKYLVIKDRYGFTMLSIDFENHENVELNPDIDTRICNLTGLQWLLNRIIKLIGDWRREK